jgi:hypothetical protein
MSPARIRKRIIRMGAFMMMMKIIFSIFYFGRINSVLFWFESGPRVFFEI